MARIIVQGHGLGPLSHSNRVDRRNVLRMTVKAINQIKEASSLNGPLNSADRPVLYVHVLCPYAQRAWLALLEKVWAPLKDQLYNKFERASFDNVSKR